MLGNIEQAPGCVNVLDVGADWVVRAVNVAPTDLAHHRNRLRTMEELWAEFRPL
jgi:probable phosphoglycerate mutase